MRIEHWEYPGPPWVFVPGGGQPKGIAGKIPGSPIPERIQGVSFGVPQSATTGLKEQQSDAQAAAFLFEVWWVRRKRTLSTLLRGGEGLGLRCQRLKKTGKFFNPGCGD